MSQNITDPRESRNIRIFISSTFNDMQAERDELVSKVFPLLRQKAAERNVSLTEIDLRWGITQEEAEESKVVEICLEEIDRSHPFFIGLLGGRYGWIPGQESVDWTQIISDRYQDAITLIRDGKSMTEIEIRHGVLQNPRNIYASFYIKEMHEKDIDPLQLQFRQEISQIQDFPVKSYSNLEELAQEVIKDFDELLDSLFPIENANDWISQRNQQRSYLQQATRFFVAPSRTEEALNAFLQNTDNKGVVLSAPSGMGKSTLLAHTVLKIEKEIDADVIAFFPNNITNGSSFNDLADWICRGLHALYDFDYDREKPHIDELQRAASEIHPERKLYLLIDGINQILPSDSANDDMVWWPQWNENVTVIFSTPKESPIFRSLERFNLKPLNLSPLTLDEKVELANRFLKGGFNKQLSRQQVEVIGTANPIMENTFVFISFLDEIRRFGSFEQLDKEIESLTGIKNTDEFFSKIISGQLSHFGTNDDIINYDIILGLIALSYDGLQESDILQLAQISRLKLSVILGMNDLYLINRGGKIQFSNETFREVFMNERLHADIGLELRDYLASHFEKQRNESNKLTPDALFEISYQYHELKDLDHLFLSISNLQAFIDFKKFGKLNELGRYWNTLLSEDSVRFDVSNVIYELLPPWCNDMYVNDMYRRLILTTQIGIIIDFANFLGWNIRYPQPAQKLLNMLLMMIESDEEQDESIYHWKDLIENNIAVYQSLNNEDTRKSLKKFCELLSDGTKFYDPLVSNIGEKLLSLYEETKDRSFLENSKLILSEVLKARIEKYATEIHPEVAVAYANLGSVEFYINLSQAIQLNKRSLEIYEALYGFYHIDVAIQYFNTGSLILRSDPQKSIEFLDKALQIYLNLHGENSEQTKKTRYMLALALLRSGEYSKALQQADFLKEWQSSVENNDLYFHLLNDIFMAAYRAGEYFRAEEVALKMLTLKIDNVEEKISVHNNLAKVEHLLNKPVESEHHYLEAVNLSLSNDRPLPAQKSLIYLAKSFMETGELQKAGDALKRVMQISSQYELAPAFELAYTYYNYGIILYNLNENVENVIKYVEEAVNIMEGITDDENEPNLLQYRQTLEKLRSTTTQNRGNNNERSEMAIEEMSEYLDGGFPQVLNNFIEAMDALDRGRVDEAKYKLSLSLEELNPDKQPAAYAQVLRYLAFTKAIILDNSVVENREENIEEIASDYERAHKLAAWYGHFDLAWQICSDEQQFFRAGKDYKMAEQTLWKWLEYLIDDGRFISLHTVTTLFNIMTSLYSGGNHDPRIAMHILLLALYIYGESEEKIDGIYDKLISYYNQLKEYIPDFDENMLEEWGYNIWKITEYLRDEEDNGKDYYDLENKLYKESLNYFKKTDDYYTALFQYVFSLREIPDFPKALSMIPELKENLPEDANEEMISDLKNLEYVNLMGVLDYEGARRYKEENNIDDSLEGTYLERFTPIYFDLINNLREEAIQALDESKNNNSESIFRDGYRQDKYMRNLFDVALSLAQMGHPFEARHAEEKWWNFIEKNLSQDIESYRKAKEFLDNKIGV